MAERTRQQQMQMQLAQQRAAEQQRILAQQQQAAMAAQARPSMQPAAGRGTGLTGYSGVYGTGKGFGITVFAAFLEQDSS